MTHSTRRGKGEMVDPMIRPERVEDQAAIRLILETAFGQPDEAGLVDRLRREDVVLVSLVAEVDGQPVGHILFTRMWIETEVGRIDAVALAPLAVHPRYQRSGIGGRLIEAGLEELRRLAEEIVIVLGHPAYYPRFGFSREKAGTLAHPFNPEAFMVLELRAGALDGISGKVVYANAFGLSR